MRNAITIILLLFFAVAGQSQSGIFDPRLSRITGHFLRDHMDVSTAGAADGDVLVYDATTRGWKAGATGAGSSSDEQVLFNDSGAITGSSGLEWDGANLQITAANPSVPKITVERTGSAGVASIDLKNTSNYWFFYANNADFGIEPQTADGFLNIRNLANTTIFRFSTSAARFEVMTGSTLRLTGKGGTGTQLAALDANNDATTVTVGAGLTLSAGSLSSTATDDQTSAEVSAAASATNYTPASATVAGHLSGIDGALSNINNIANVSAPSPSDGQILQYQSLTSTWDAVTPDVSYITGSATLDFGSTAAQTSADLTITVTGAALGDVVSVGVPNGSAGTDVCYTAWVSATDTVTVRFNNYSATGVDPASGTFKVMVSKW